MSAVSETPSATQRLGTFRYLQASVESSLYRNGKVLTRRNLDGTDGGRGR